MPARHQHHREPPGATKPRSNRVSLRLRTGIACAAAAIALAATGCAGARRATPPSSAPAATSATGPSATSGSKGGTLPGTGYPPAYWTTIRQQLARSLHRSVTELTRLWGASAPAGPKGSGGQATTTIVDIAAEDGLSTAQLRTAELAAIRQALTVVVQHGTITSSQAGTQLATIASWDQSSLDGYAMSAFQPH